MTIRLTAAAISDLKAIRLFTLENWGADQEHRYLESLWSKFEEILSTPSKWRFRNDLFPDCQVASCGRHVILFRIDSEILEIVRILHATMDLPQHIPADLLQLRPKKRKPAR